jgi:hypothetical protein
MPTNSVTSVPNVVNCQNLVFVAKMTGPAGKTSVKEHGTKNVLTSNPSPNSSTKGILFLFKILLIRQKYPTCIYETLQQEEKTNK